MAKSNKTSGRVQLRCDQRRHGGVTRYVEGGTLSWTDPATSLPRKLRSAEAIDRAEIPEHILARYGHRFVPEGAETIGEPVPPATREKPNPVASLRDVAQTGDVKDGEAVQKD